MRISREASSSLVLGHGRGTSVGVSGVAALTAAIGVCVWRPETARVGEVLGKSELVVYARGWQFEVVVDGKPSDAVLHMLQLEAEGFYLQPRGVRKGKLWRCGDESKLFSKSEAKVFCAQLAKDSKLPFAVHQSDFIACARDIQTCVETESELLPQFEAEFSRLLTEEFKNLPLCGANEQEALEQTAKYLDPLLAMSHNNWMAFVNAPCPSALRRLLVTLRYESKQRQLINFKRWLNRFHSNALEESSDA